MLLVILSLGAAVRVWGFLSAGSFWLDELFIVDNLRELGFLELLGPLEHGQNAPVGWLLGMKAIGLVLGPSEWGLRLPSLVASLLSLPLAWCAARRILDTRWALIALSLVAFSPFVVWQAFQVKQYSVDLLVSLVCLVEALKAEENPGRGVARLAIIGWLSIWMSMPAVFSLAAIALARLAAAWSRERSLGREVRGALGLAAVWGTTFGVNYWSFLQLDRQPGWLYDFWQSGLLPRPFEIGSALAWLARVVPEALEDPVGFVAVGTVPAAVVTLGCLWWLFSGLPAMSSKASLAALPVLLAIAAATLGMYPFASRLVLFLVPHLAILFVLGVRALSGESRWRQRLAGSLAIVLLAVPIAALLLWVPRGGLPKTADTRGLFKSLEERAAPEDVVVIDHVTSYAWSTYGEDRAEPALTVPPAWGDLERVERLRQELKRLAERDEGPKRVWVAIAQVMDDPRISFKDSIQRDLSQRQLTLPHTYTWLASSQHAWAPLELFGNAIPSEWSLEEEIRTKGCVLWRLERGDRHSKVRANT